MSQGSGGVDGNKGNMREFTNKYIEEGHDDLNQAAFICTVCNKPCKTRFLAENHVESLHFPGYFQHRCKICDEVLPTRKRYYHHINKIHKSAKLANSAYYHARRRMI
eukprot:TRINITY_DN50463_c0_g1_i1.p1 TRINITY_DN50463_c0_g1~~TRINITY_DN50463_c0_g1_i1.p1  ORF type:complete len:107 (+),score=21.38 TRINITY_DN50463_c0_g1_i1:2-322(+)